ncbi:PP2C family protein-serine/threonine phosphatase [Streptomyces sp. NPDC059740]|uniref:PP2C family protein-serine/threonine phosphatase n=1 Tax=Streptomyces sp. NPDC059740 TaxID=3346926 RepID=UPI00365F3A9F
MSPTPDAESALRAERHRTAFLEETGRRIGASLHPARTARAVARAALPLLADTAVVVLPVAGRRASWHRAGPGDREESGQVGAEELTGVPQLLDALSGAEGPAHPFPAAALAPLAPLLPDAEGQALALPLAGNGVSAGALLLVRAGRPAPDEADLALARRFTDRAGPALATALLYAQQARTTAAVQAHLTPSPLPAADGVRLGAAYRPAAESLRVSGDFYHVTADPAGVSFFFGDVCGKGPEAAVRAGMVRQSLRVLTLADAAPTAQLDLLNRALLADEAPFTTLVTGTARPARGGGLAVATAGGGHLPPLVLRADGGVEEVGLEGTLVGVLPDADFDLTRTHLAPGESMVLYSDGVTEARGGPTGEEFYGEERLARDLAEGAGMPAATLAERVEMLTTHWLAGRDHDDIAVLVLQAPAGPGDH